MKVDLSLEHVEGLVGSPVPVKRKLQARLEGAFEDQEVAARAVVGGLDDHVAGPYQLPFARLEHGGLVG
jgi:hypothetical protein